MKYFSSCVSCSASITNATSEDQSVVRYKDRFAALLRWAIPGALLALVPKCPLCVAAYVAVATGWGISFTAATVLRSSLIAIAWISLAYLVARLIERRLMRRRRII